MLRSSAQIPLSRSCPSCFTLPQSCTLATPTLRVLNLPVLRFLHYLSVHQDPLGFTSLLRLAQAPWFSEHCWFSLAIDPLRLLVIQSRPDADCESLTGPLHPQAWVTEHGWRRSLRFFNQSQQKLTQLFQTPTSPSCLCPTTSLPPSRWPGL